VIQPQAGRTLGRIASRIRSKTSLTFRTIASTAAGVIDPALHAAHSARSRSRPITDLTAHHLFFAF
jgi:hypothetical protein